MISCYIYFIPASPFSNLSVTSPTSQLILQPFRRFTSFTAHYPTLPLLHLRHSSFSNPSFASPTSQALPLRHLGRRPCQDRLKLLPPDVSTGALWWGKRYPSTLISDFLTGCRFFSYEVSTQLSQGWVEPAPDPILPEKNCRVQPNQTWELLGGSSMR